MYVIRRSLVCFQSFGLFVGIACQQMNQVMTVSITFQMTIMLLGKVRGFYTCVVNLEKRVNFSFNKPGIHSMFLLQYVVVFLLPFFCVYIHINKTFHRRLCLVTLAHRQPSHTILSGFLFYIYPIRALC